MNYKPTYSKIIDSIRTEFDGEDAERLARKSDEAFQVHILEAEQRICDEFEVDEECTLRLSEDVDEYFVNEHNPIADVSNATPMSVRSVAHGLTTADIINQRFVQGNEAGNGSFRATRTDADNYTLSEFYRISGISQDNPAEFTTEKNHGWSTGKVVTLEDCGSSFNSSQTITVTGDKTFTVPVTGVGNTYASGGKVYAPAAGSGAYTAGGRFWKENEIPSHLWRFEYGARTATGVQRVLSFINNGKFLDDRNWSLASYKPGVFYTPHQAVHLRRGGQRYIKVWPMPSEAQDVTLHAVMKIEPTLYYDDPVTASIHLEEEWVPVITRYLMSKAYGWLKDFKNRDMEMNEFERRFNARKLTSDKKETIQVVYQ